MRELSEEERRLLVELLEDGRDLDALVALVRWGRSMDPALPHGQTHPRAQGWRRAEHAPEQVPPVESLADMADHAEAWAACPVRGLLLRLEEAIDLDWQSQRRLFAKASDAEGRHHWVVRKHAWLGSTRADRMPDGLEGMLSRFHVLASDHEPGWCVELVPLDHAVLGRLGASMVAPSAYLVHFDEPFRLLTRQHPGALQVMAIDDPEAHLAALQRHAGGSRHCTFAVWPECTMPPQALFALQSTLPSLGGDAPCLTWAGSFHLPQGDCCQNRASLLDHRGVEIVGHVKTCSAALRGPNDESLAEHIETHNAVHALPTPHGTIGLAICIELSHPTNGLQAVWARLAPEWMLVASMGEQSTIDQHRAVAAQLAATHKTTTLVSNQSARGGSVLGFALDGAVAASASAAATPEVNCRLELRPHGSIK